jgi:alpha-galactosidase
MADDLFISQERWLPQYATVIAAAKARTATTPRLPTRDNAGAARLHERTVDELRQERRPSPAQADADRALGAAG